MGAATAAEAQKSFAESLRGPLSEVAKLGEADIVVGVPFYNEADTIGDVLGTIRQGLSWYYPSQKCVLVAVGCPAGGEALRMARAAPHGDEAAFISFLFDSERNSGKGWAVWAIMEIARTLGADLAILEADLRSRERDGEKEGLTPEWVRLLLDPIRIADMDFVISRFNRHYLESPIATHVFYPFLTAIYGCPVRDLTGGQVGISYGLLRGYLQRSPHPPSAEAGGYGVDAWLAASAVAAGARVAEANLGIKIHRPVPSVAKAELVLNQAARVLFEEAAADHDLWERWATGEAVVRPLPVFGSKKRHLPDEVQVVPAQLVEKYRQGFTRFRALYQWVLPGEAYGRMEMMAEEDAESFRFPHDLWAEVVYHLLLAATFTTEFAEGDLISSLVTAYDGHLASFALETGALKERLLQSLAPQEAEHLVSLEAERQVQLMVDEFMRLRPDFISVWEMKEEERRPPVPNVTYREFIPGVPLVVPSELVTPEGTTVTANAIYEGIFHRYQQQFQQFVHEKLGLSEGAGSGEIVERIRDFMLRVERELGETVFSSDLSTVEGTREIVDVIFRYFRRQDGFSLVPEMASWLLWRYPPTSLITRLGYTYLNELLDRFDANDVLALASWVEEHDYKEQVSTLIKESIRPEHLARHPVKPLVVDIEEFPSLAEMKESPSLSRVAGRLVLSNLRKGMGGELPRLRYLTTVAKSIVEAERFGEVWQQFAEERKDFSEKVINSLEGHWGKTPLSAHNIFENEHQRVFVQRLREMASRIAEEAPDDEVRAALAGHLRDVADNYHLATTLPDGTFVPLSAWTWASYSFKGGTGVPTPLSLHVERDWSSREFLTEYYLAAGGKEEDIDARVLDLMAQGKEYEDLTPILFGRMREAESVVRQTVPAEEQPPAKALVRFEGNPVLAPVKEHPWESKYLLNPGAVRLDGKVYLVYRAVGEDGISRLGLAVSEDGFHFTERLDEPIFEPRGQSESLGCEDPRLTLLDDRVYMVYTAYATPIAQISIASISVDDFVNHRWRGWHRHGLAFPGFTDKDGALFPERFDDKFAMLHRVDPHIWITFSPHIRGPWPRKEHKILAGSRPGMVWDSLKIGGGSQPLKTEYGWLLIYHGVDHNHVYRLGVMLLDLMNPSVLLYRSPNYVLEPTEHFEVGEEGGEYWIPNVVFTCGAVPKEDGKGVLSARDEILVYYGAADSFIAVASARVEDLVPEEFR